MAIKRIFHGMEISLPSGSGTVKCAKCGSLNGWNCYGPNREGDFAYSVGCLDCGYSYKNENWIDYKAEKK
jgi:hypothetical protein